MIKYDWVVIVDRDNWWDESQLILRVGYGCLISSVWLTKVFTRKPLRSKDNKSYVVTIEWLKPFCFDKQIVLVDTQEGQLLSIITVTILRYANFMEEVEMHEL